MVAILLWVTTLHMHYIYTIQNNINLKIYIGQSKNPKRRWQAHINESIRKPSQLIHKALKKHGHNNFTFQIIEEFENLIDCNQAEEFWIAFFRATDRMYGYNLALGGNSSPRSEEWKKQMSEKFKGKTFHNKSPFVKGHQIRRKKSYKGRPAPWFKGKPRLDMTGENNYFYGKNLYGEKAHRAKLTQAIANQIRTEFSSGNVTIKELSIKYGVGQTCISDVVHNRRWI